MAKLLLNANGKVLMKDDKVYKAPESTLKKLLDATKSGNYLFYYYQGISVDDLISYSDTENVTSMHDMFYNCKKLQTIPQLNTSNVTNMVNMFYGCVKIKSIPQLDTSNVGDMTKMFDDCRFLTTIDITSMDRIDYTSSSSYFASGCFYLTKFIIRTMTKIPPLNTNSFNNCYHFTGTVNAAYNPNGDKDGRIYVPDDYVEQLKQATNWSAYADIIVPLSTLVED